MSRIGLLGLVLTTVTGCVSFSDRHFDPVTRELSRQAPELEMRKEFAISIGSTLINTVDLLAVGSELDFSSLDKVQVAIYRIPLDADLQHVDVTSSLAELNRSLTWDTVVRVRDPGEQTWVLMGMDERRQTIRAVSLMVVQQGELVLVHVDGEMEQMIDFALRPARERQGLSHS
ncbi:MAG: hypothetical protein R3F41_16040 [Gammaproteobacteria bacterium]|nr:hypothetical protein [Pseudomonadales bacterium]MCP5346717.1 hypothetical protein [Pseudomonadales bacterium]